MVVIKGQLDHKKESWANGNCPSPSNTQTDVYAQRPFSCQGAAKEEKSGINGSTEPLLLLLLLIIILPNSLYSYTSLLISA